MQHPGPERPTRTIHDLTAPGATAPTTVPPPPRRWKTRVLVPGGLLVLTAGLFLAVGGESLARRTPVRVAPVVAKQGAAGPGAAQLQASGWLEPDPFPTIVSALVPGVVSEVLVLEGATVTSGQVVARLIDADARLTVEQSRAELTLARAEHAMARTECAAVCSANALLIDRRRDVEVQHAQVDRGESELRQLDASITAQGKTVAALRDEHQRALRLLQGGAETEGQATQLGLRLEAATSTLEALRRRVAVVEADLRQARALATASERHLETLVEEHRAEELAQARLVREAANVRRAEARLANAELALARHEVRAPCAGVVMRTEVAPGFRMMPDGDRPHAAHVLHLYDPSSLQARVDVPLAEAARVGVGQPAQVQVETLPDRWFDAQVTRVVHQADVQKNTVEFKVRLDAPDRQLKPDMLVRVRFLASSPTDTERVHTWIPRAALVGGPTPQVFVVRERRGDAGWVELRAIQPGPQREDAIAVEGLRLGDEVVVAPPPGLDHGDLVSVQGEAP